MSEENFERQFNDFLEVPEIDFDETIEKYLDFVKNFIIDIFQEDLDALKYFLRNKEAREFFEVSINPEEIKEIQYDIWDANQVYEVIRKTEDLNKIIWLVSLMLEIRPDQAQALKNGIIESINEEVEGMETLFISILLEHGHLFPCPVHECLNFEYIPKKKAFAIPCAGCRLTKICRINKLVFKIISRLYKE